MKRMFSLFSMLFFIFICNGVWGQSVPNGDFENWDKYTTYENPRFWKTPNDLTATIDVFTVLKESSNIHSGDYSARLESKSFMTMTIPGFMTLGDFSFEMTTMDYEIFGGIPFSDRPAFLSGYHKYAPSTGDSLFISVILFKYDTVNKKQDTIGFGYKLDGNSVSSWSAFSIPIQYLSSETPDSMNIVILSSASMSAPAGTILLIDSLHFGNTPLSLEDDLSINKIYIYPNPAHERLCIEADVPIEAVEVYSITAVHISTYFPKESNKIIIDCSNYRAGLYLIRLRSEGLWYEKKVIINR